MCIRDRSYAVESNKKFAKTSVLLGLDASFAYQKNSHQFGFGIYPYVHTHIFYGFDLVRFKNLDVSYKIIPEIMLGYSWDLEKYYTGFSVGFQYKFIKADIFRTLHIKSGESKYWGDGLTGFSLGLVFRISNDRN